MPRILLLLVVVSSCALGLAQSVGSDEALLAKARALYDAPFTRNLFSFDCAVQFNWTSHLKELVGALPPAAMETADRLQKIHHRVAVDHNRAVVSTQPKELDLSDSQAARQMEQILNTMISQGLDAWLPSAMNEILPMKPTKFSFEEMETGYKVTMTGTNVDGKLLLGQDLRVTSGVLQLPQPTRFTTSFIDGPQGYLLESVRTGATDGSTGGEATFAYTYQSVENFQLPSVVTVRPSTTKPWHYGLTDCKIVTGIKIEVLPPPSRK
jgi:hypothetical protein